ncbi:bifunctional folylpolyglutamate synthase/dihydrofolate synthase [candidate division KSB1 bacterium]|nr:bifunctional folylpolyglutamate synthase/dihydrofolate synthase [candidate division KSB1 bacterium]
MLDRLQDVSADTLRYLDSLGFLGWQLGLERIEKLCAFWGNPHTRYPIVHLAGTNGKGSTAAMLSAIGQAAGLRVGLYTSPHLVHPRERMQINGVPISGRELERALQSSRHVADSLQATYFEVLTAIAFHWFDEQRVDLGIIETGLGGRWDATNVVVPEVAIITSIALEHQQYLGKTLVQIAQEKAGIIKTGWPCVSGVKAKSARGVIAAECEAKNAPFIAVHAEARCSAVQLLETGTRFRLHAPRLNEDSQLYHLNLLGRHQVDNAMLAIWASHILQTRGLPITAAACAEGLKHVHWPGRMQLLETSPRTLVDAAHNADGMRKLTRSIRALYPQRRVKVVMSLLKDKALTQALRAWLALQPEFFFATAANDRALAAEQMHAAARRLGFVAHVSATPRAAFELARARCAAEDLLCVTGSHYLIGELMEQGLLPYPY